MSPSQNACTANMHLVDKGLEQIVSIGCCCFINSTVPFSMIVHLFVTTRSSHVEENSKVMIE